MFVSIWFKKDESNQCTFAQLLFLSEKELEIYHKCQKNADIWKKVLSIFLLNQGLEIVTNVYAFQEVI